MSKWSKIIIFRELEDIAALAVLKETSAASVTVVLT
jgi:hypothetical protein